MKKFITLSVFLGLMLAHAPEALARNFYGAIAYSPSAGHVGYSYNHGSRAVAESDALRRCAAHGGGCRVVIWFRNSCAALAVSSRGYASYWAGTRALAERNAHIACRRYGASCVTRAWTCTTR